MIQLDKLVIGTVQAQVQQFRADAAASVAEIFWNETAANQAIIAQWYGNAANQIAWSVGWPERVIVQPGVWAILQTGQERQAADVQSVGYFGTSAGQRAQAIAMEEAVALVVAGPNQNEVLWLQGLVRWALYQQRLALQTQYGLNDQILSLSELRPLPNSQGDVIFPFSRAVTLRCWYYDPYTPVAAAPITGASVTVEVANNG